MIESRLQTIILVLSFFLSLDWSFFMNTVGTELPLVTNKEISMGLNNSIVETVEPPPSVQYRIKTIHRLQRQASDDSIIALVKDWTEKGPDFGQLYNSRTSAKK